MTRGRGMIERSASTGVTCSTSSPPVLPSALLVDCDGVRVDTDKYGHRISFNDSFGEKGLGVLLGMWMCMVNCSLEVEKKE
ncbi:CBBY-like protein [Tripterygium wilfordii]|uniref:CBBY-like protein n=1 Tax=Tripterygium wilfordii TaxID=458696 RepID=UPI0018F80804|nr:CBBY-like protein [Tripterygium wilfordii]